MSERIWNRSLQFTAIAVAIISSISVWLAWNTSGNLLARLSLLAFLPVLGAAVFSYSLRILRFHYFLSRSGIAIPLRGTIIVQCIGFALSVTPGHVGEVFKLHLIRERSGIPVVQTAPLLLLDRLTEGGGFMILATGSAWLLPKAITATPVPTLMLLGLALLVLFALTRRRWYHYGTAVANSRLGQFQIFRGLAPHLKNLWRGLDTSIVPSQVLGGLAMSALARFADGFVVLFAARMVGVELTLPSAVFVLAVSGLAGGISVLPAGIGAVETTMIGLLTLFGASLPDALAITLLARLCTLWLWVALGLAMAFRMNLPSFGTRLEESDKI